VTSTDSVRRSRPEYSERPNRTDSVWPQRLPSTTAAVGATEKNLFGSSKTRRLNFDTRASPTHRHGPNRPGHSINASPGSQTPARTPSASRHSRAWAGCLSGLRVKRVARPLLGRARWLRALSPSSNFEQNTDRRGHEIRIRYTLFWTRAENYFRAAICDAN
jgi:hypothetical protein